MRIAFLVTRLDKPSARYRILQYIPFLEEKGYHSSVYVIPKNTMDRIGVFRKLRDYDIVFLQKKLLNLYEWRCLRKISRRLIYDFDDAVMFRDSSNRKQLASRRLKRFVRTVRNSDMVIAGNEYLRNLSVRENLDTFVVPTSLDIGRYREKPNNCPSENIILGWIGSSSTLFYLEEKKDIWDSIHDRFPGTRLKIVADKFFDCRRMPVIKKSWKYEEEIDDLYTFDIGLMPLTDDPWSRGKCGFKLLQYMAVGIPAVCSPVGVNEKIVSDGLNGFLAHDDDEWMEKLGLLIEDVKLRYEFGREARKKIIGEYSLDLSRERLVTLLNTLNDGKTVSCCHN